MEYKDYWRSKFTIAAIITYIVGSFSVGFGTACVNNIGIQVHQLEVSQATLIVTMGALGFVISAPLAGYLLTRNLISRRRLM